MANGVLQRHFGQSPWNDQSLVTRRVSEKQVNCMFSSLTRFGFAILRQMANGLSQHSQRATPLDQENTLPFWPTAKFNSTRVG
ncbi:hypothetical protein RE6C_02186 [Rhodopirellula europaea 6C]|uniref:Uncharacterized protein n=1 Tax=Rhodopirellula europaea 6C TaxID=1263867 RepID=M2AIY4_9BACT|nr:hypothetical protein RE6C_02186 [Rhodopirellula europaea 6C]